jgi:hypothetical protein
MRAGEGFTAGIGSEALECGSLLPLSSPRACSRDFERVSNSRAASWLAKVKLEIRQQAGWRKSCSKLPHSKASHRTPTGKRFSAASLEAVSELAKSLFLERMINNIGCAEV